MNWRFTKQLVKILAIAFLTIALLQTFAQEAFKSVVSANLLVYRTPEYPIFYFIVGFFLLGLFIGLMMAIVDHYKMARDMQDLIDENRAITKTIPVTEEVQEDSEPEEDEDEEKEEKPKKEAKKEDDSDDEEAPEA